MTNYQPLATSPTVADVVESQQHKLPVRRRWHLRARPLLLLCLLGTCSLFGILYALFLRPSSYETIALKVTDNLYFQTGDVWTHNDQVAARLERCTSLGLLRNTSLPFSNNFGPSTSNTYRSVQDQPTPSSHSTYVYATTLPSSSYLGSTTPKNWIRKNSCMR